MAGTYAIVDLSMFVLGAWHKRVLHPGWCALEGVRETHASVARKRHGTHASFRCHTKRLCIVLGLLDM